MADATAITIVDAKEVILPDGSYMVVSSRHIVKESDFAYMNLHPGQARNIGHIIMHKCDTDTRNKIVANPKFWINKTHTGCKFLNRLRQLKRTAIKKRFAVVGPRLSSRRKGPRAKQCVADNVSIHLPNGHDVIMLNDPPSKNGRMALSILLSPPSIEGIALYFKDFVSTCRDDDTQETNSFDQGDENHGDADNDSPHEDSGDKIMGDEGADDDADDDDDDGGDDDGDADKQEKIEDMPNIDDNTQSKDEPARPAYDIRSAFKRCAQK
jgi:hypothetical protein